MCGICGLIDLSGTADPRRTAATVEAMNAALEHRGPDDAAVRSFGATALAMRRVAVIDLDTGRQPLYSEDGRICAFQNGEIYNYRELRESLARQGHAFRTASDTEVLVHLYEEYGTAMPAHLKGMFAFCIYDQARDQVFFSRDRFGEKPLYYHHRDGALSFSSELGSLLANEAIPRVLNVEALGYHLKVGMVPEPLTLFEGVYSLPPGHSMVLAGRDLAVEPYFRVHYQHDRSLKSLPDCTAYLRPFLEQAVSRQLVSDVPIGAFLSGGIDSSTVAALMQAQSRERIKTFTVRFEEATYDESPIAREVAAHLGTEHHEITIPNHDFTEELFWKIVDHTGQPFSDSSAIPSYLVSQEIRKHVTVALSGDGGDEVFGGYPMFQWWLRIHGARSIPLPVRRAALAVVGAAAGAPGLNGVSALRQVRKALAFSTLDPKAVAVEISTMFEDQHLERLYRGRPPAGFPLLEDYWDEASGWTPLRKVMHYRLKYNLAIDMLVKVDRMSMANSLEVRAPFLDPDLFEASCRIPDDLLIRNKKGKFIVREIMRDQLPQSVFDHPKSGFSIPLHRYQNEEFVRLTERLFTADNPLSELFSLEEVQRVKEVGLRTQRNDASASVYRTAHRLWTLTLLFAWAERFQVSLPSTELVKPTT